MLPQINHVVYARAFFAEVYECLQFCRRPSIVVASSFAFMFIKCIQLLLLRNYFLLRGP